MTGSDIVDSSEGAAPSLLLDNHSGPTAARYDAVMVFALPRSGSSALCDGLSLWLRQQGFTAENWEEFLAPQKYLTASETGYTIRSLQQDTVPFGAETIWLSSRPSTPHVVRAKMALWQQHRVDHMIVSKLMPFDLRDGADLLINQMVLGDDRVLKLGINRMDVGNALISWLIGMHHGIWYGSAVDIMDRLQRPIEPIMVSADLLQRYVNLVQQHNHWLWYSADRLDRILWFHDLRDLHIPELGFRGILPTKIQLTPMDHEARARRCFANADEVLACAHELEIALRPLISNVLELCQRRGW